MGARRRQGLAICFCIVNGHISATPLRKSCLPLSATGVADVALSSCKGATSSFGHAARSLRGGIDFCFGFLGITPTLILLWHSDYSLAVIWISAVSNLGATIEPIAPARSIKV
jgi:hypothetical protein